MPKDLTHDIAKSLGYQVETSLADIANVVKPLIPVAIAGAMLSKAEKPKPLSLDTVKVGDKVDIYNKGGSRIYRSVQVTAINTESNTIRIQGPSGAKALDLKTVNLARPT